MTSNQKNPCMTCATHQHCCRELEDLRLTPAEYVRHFHEYRQELSVHQKGPVYKASVKPDHTCPHWKDRCTIYDERPRECRLFPHTIGAVLVFRRRALLTFHARDSGCPQTEALVMPREQARALVASFAGEAFDERYTVTILHEPLVLHWILNAARRLVWQFRQAASLLT